MVFGCRANHGWAADIDVLDGGRQVAAWLVDGGFERVQVNGRRGFSGAGS
jgi:hypothetical protein